ncbi:hypothetical protein FJY90_01245 [Candidatus Gottesmanbacteria bacterium]|nr:hypothetical protein [Candidatus Gottesmanbacteria bacterium]
MSQKIVGEVIQKEQENKYVSYQYVIQVTDPLWAQPKVLYQSYSGLHLLSCNSGLDWYIPKKHKMQIYVCLV